MARPKKNKKDLKQAVSVTLEKHQLKALRKFGNGNVSHGVRKLVDILMETELLTTKKQG